MCGTGEGKEEWDLVPILQYIQSDIIAMLLFNAPTALQKNSPTSRQDTQNFNNILPLTYVAHQSTPYPYISSCSYKNTLCCFTSACLSTNSDLSQVSLFTTHSSSFSSDSTFIVKKLLQTVSHSLLRTHSLWLHASHYFWQFTDLFHSPDCGLLGDSDYPAHLHSSCA